MVAGIKVSQLPPVTGENAQTNDLFVLARESSSQNFKFSRGELFSSTPPISVSGDIAVTGTVDGRDVAFDGELLDGFETRAELVTWWATNNSSVPDGFVVSVGSLRWVKDGGTDIADLSGLSPCWPYSTEHFPNVVAARTWSGTNEYLIQDLTADPKGSRWKIGPNLAAAENDSWADAALGVQRTKSSTGTGDHGIAAMIDMTGVTADTYAAGYAGSFMAYNATTQTVGRAFTAGVRAGAQIYGTSNGNVRAGLFEASFPLDNTGGTVAGTLTGIEVAAKNFGGNETSEVESPTDDISRNILFAQGGDDPAADHNLTTTMMMNGVAGPGWYKGWAVSNVHQDYVYAFGPAASGAKFANIQPDSNWAESLISIPEGKGIGSTPDGATITTALTMDAGTAGAVNVPVGLKLGGGSDLLGIYEQGTFTPVLSDGTNNATQTAQQGYYTRIGGIIIGFIRIVCSDVSSLSGDLRITGLPYGLASGLNNNGGGTSIAADGLSLSSDGPVHMLIAGAGNTHGLLFVSDVASGGTTALSSSEVTNSTVIQIPFQYPV